MEANELRIGNLTQDKVTKIAYTITANALLYLVACKEEDKESPIEPIPLTEEWLLKFGFVKDYYRINDQSVPERFIEDDIWRLEDDLHLYCKSGVWYLMDEYDSLLSFKREMKGVHDLQNLFFALKGKELTINK